MLRRLGLVTSTLLALLALLELVLRVLPVSTSTETGYYIGPDILVYPPGHEWRVATGWDLRNAQTLRANNLGFASMRDFVPDPQAVALIGDSFIEASMLDADQRPAAQLEKALAGRPVYGMGGPGSSLLDYADRVQLARERLRVRDFVVMVESGDVRQAICGSGNVHSACLDRGSLEPRRERRAGHGAFKKLARRSALAQYLFSQLKLRPEQLLTLWKPDGTAAAGTSDGVPGLDRRQVQAVVDTFFARVGPSGAHGQMILVVDGSRKPAQQPLNPEFSAERSALIETAIRQGVTVIDAEEAYLAHRAHSSRSLEVGPYDRHLNGQAVGLLMVRAAQELRRGLTFESGRNAGRRDGG